MNINTYFITYYIFVILNNVSETFLNVHNEKNDTACFSHTEEKAPDVRG